MEQAVIKKGNRFWTVALLLLLATWLSAQNLDYYVRFDFHFFICLIVLPFVLFVKRRGDHSIKYGIISLLFLGLYPFLKIQVCYFLGYAFFGLFLIESFIGKLNNLPLFLVAIISPLSVFVLEVLGFPIRLQLTEFAAHILQYIRTDVTYSGNLIYIGEGEFSVDRACTGLKMVITSLVICLGLIAFQEKKRKMHLGIPASFVLLGLTFGLVILSNLLRIIGLVIFGFPPDTFGHEAIGLLCLIVYVILPIYLLIPIVTKKFGREIKLRRLAAAPKKTRFVLIVLILSTLGIQNHRRDLYHRVEYDAGVHALDIPGYDKEMLGNGVAKLQNDLSLVYVKPFSSFYGADHTPLICWKGSGYVFQKEETIKIDECDVVLAELKSDSDLIYTAWWYDNGHHKTTGQFDWRYRSMIGEEPFRIVNVSSDSRANLIPTVRKLIAMNLFDQDADKVIAER